MKSITYLNGDATAPKTAGRKIIVHTCNDVGGWGRGFVLAISKRWSLPETAYRRWYAERGDNDFSLGSVQFVTVEPDFWVGNMIGQHGVKHTPSGAAPIRYDAVQSCLKKVAEFAAEHRASIHMPRIGCGLAGGKWEEIEPLIAATCFASDVYVYDFE